MLDDISVSLALAGLHYILILFLWKRKDISQLIQALGDYSKFGTPEDAKHVNDSFNLYTKLYYIYCIVGANLYFLLAQTVEANTCKKNNEKFGRDEVCGFFSNIWLPFDYDTTPTYEVLCALQYLASLYATPVLTIPFIIFVILQHMICKIKHLRNMATEVFEVEDPSIQKERLGNWIRYHQDIIRLQM